ncbi:MAG: HEAT repeat domain-containing protein [Termitinemataceae bacterium]|nr:MAG: HEAT repeat domain-containing protein [Termitinemataceae bacterium]
MNILKNSAVLFFALVVSSFTFAQEKSVEDTYLQQNVEIMIVREQANSLNRDDKMLALEYVRQMLENGNAGDEVRSVLTGLATDGTLNKVRDEGRTANNYPDVRLKAVSYMGQIKTKESANSLVKVILIEPNPEVVSEAIHSLEKIGINEGDEIVNAISFVFTRFDARQPDNVLALAVIDALDAFTRNTGSKNSEIYKILGSISNNSHYATPVRNYAAKKLAGIYKVANK